MEVEQLGMRGMNADEVTRSSKEAMARMLKTHKS